MSTRAARLATAVVATAVSLGAVGSVASAAPGGHGPVLTAAPSVAAPGTTMAVQATGFPPSTNWLVAICGNLGLGGSPDCDQGHAQERASSQLGTFGASIVVGIPPAPCPCVIEASPSLSQPSAASPFSKPVTTPITVVGAPLSPPHPPAPVRPYSGLHVVHLALIGSGPWQSWFGAGPRRTLDITVRNEGAVAIPALPFVLSAGRPSNPSLPVPAPSIGALGPGQSASLRIPVTFEALSFGTYEVRGTLGPLGQASVLVTTTTLIPWGLVGIAAALVLGLVVALVRRIRHRRRRRNQRRGGAGAQPLGSGDRAPEVVPGRQAGAVTVAGHDQPAASRPFPSGGTREGG